MVNRNRMCMSKVYDRSVGDTNIVQHLVLSRDKELLELLLFPSTYNFRNEQTAMLLVLVLS